MQVIIGPPGYVATALNKGYKQWVRMQRAERLICKCVLWEPNINKSLNKGK